MAKHSVGIGCGRLPVTKPLAQPKRGGHCRKEIGSQCDRALIAISRFGEELLCLEREGEGEKCVGRAWVDPNPTTKARFGLRVPAESLQHVSKMVPTGGELGIE